MVVLPNRYVPPEPQELTAATLRVDPNVELGSCAPNDDRYVQLFFRNLPFEDWPDAYHSIVNQIVEEYLNPTTDIQCDSTELLSPDPDSALFENASKLPPWDTPQEQSGLTRNDVGFVLLELLRVYECALEDRENFVTLYVKEELDPSERDSYTYGKEKAIAQVQRSVIDRELKIARPSLERALLILASSTRLGPLDAELQCLQRASLDLRNAFALAADASSCFPPKLWNTRDVLRDTQ